MATEGTVADKEVPNNGYFCLQEIAPCDNIWAVKLLDL